VAIAALVTLTPKEGKRQELEDSLSEVLKEVRTEPGNILAMVLRDPTQPDKVFEFAVFRDQKAIEDHWAAEHSVRAEPKIGALMQNKHEPHRYEVVGWPEAKLTQSVS
jgi:quinol monooxygenase YgiN